MNVSELGPGFDLWTPIIFGIICSALPLVVSSIDKLESKEVAKCGLGVMLIISALFSLSPVEKALNKRLDSAFSRELLEQYGAYSNKSYTEIRKDLDEDGEAEAEIVLKRNDGVTDVLVLERHGELMFIGDEGMYPKKEG